MAWWRPCRGQPGPGTVDPGCGFKISRLQERHTQTECRVRRNLEKERFQLTQKDGPAVAEAQSNFPSRMPGRRKRRMKTELVTGDGFIRPRFSRVKKKKKKIIEISGNIISEENFKFWSCKPAPNSSSQPSPHFFPPNRPYPDPFFSLSVWTLQ